MATAEGARDATAGVSVLTIADLPRLRSAGNPSVDESEIAAVLQQSPDGSFWVPETGEFILVAPWRSRSELRNIHTLWSFRSDAPLIRAATDAAMRAGAAALIMLETGERRRPSFYHQHGFSRIEIIRTYEHMELEVLARQAVPGTNHFVRVTPERADLLALVERLDHAAFPWFWWNSSAEFETYLKFHGVEVWAGVIDRTLVSYIGFTSFHHWAHLDRIAVAPGLQGKGYGRTAVAFAAQRMVRSGARRVGLSTQSSNRISRRMYESLGFRHTRQSDYDVFGIVIDAERVNQGPGKVSQRDEG